MTDPKPPGGMSPAAIWFKQLTDWTKQFRLLPAPGYRIRRYPDGYAIDLLNLGGGQAAPSSPLSFYTFQSHGQFGPPDQTDYVLAQPLGGGATVLVVKPPLLRFSLNFHQHSGMNFSNYDPNAQTRIAAAAGFQITQTITPMYQKNDILYVATVAGVLYDLNADSRTFAGP